MNAGAVAVPSAPVTTDTAVAPPAKVPLAPEEGALKVTGTFDTPAPVLSVTSADKAFGKAVLTAADCPEPAEAVILLALVPVVSTSCGVLLLLSRLANCLSVVAVVVTTNVYVPLPVTVLPTSSCAQVSVVIVGIAPIISELAGGALL